MQKITGRKLNIIMEYDQIEKLDRIAERFNMRRVQALRLILDTGLDAYEMYEAAGVVKIAELAIKTRNAVKEYLQPSLV